jgi:DNA-binding PadR family transcriptional regulator
MFKETTMSLMPRSVDLFAPQEIRIFEVLLTLEPAYGMEIMHADPRLPMGSVYALLHRMEGKGFVQSSYEARDPHTSGVPRRYYTSTKYGRKVFNLQKKLVQLQEEHELARA